MKRKNFFTAMLAFFFPWKPEGASGQKHVQLNAVAGGADYGGFRITPEGFRAYFETDVSLQEDSSGKFWISPFNGRKYYCPWTDEELSESRKKMKNEPRTPKI